MGQPELTLDCASEAELAAHAAAFGRVLRCLGPAPLVIGLRGDLGSGKTTWARALLRGLGHRGRVPSPTYTLLEHYDCDGLAIVHLDLYRLGGEDELENLGLRDWLGEPRTVLLVEWPERAPGLAARCDVVLELTVTAPTARRVALYAQGRAGHELAAAVVERGS
jgi:tRNA threonylcarbamoyladenosine biosynthesis protein TsaE